MTGEIVGSLDELLGGGAQCLPMDTDGKSGASVERVERDGSSFVLKVQRRSLDWIMRAVGDEDFWMHELWGSGALASLPASIDPAVVGLARYEESGEPVLAVLMEDLGPWLVPDGDEPISIEDQDGFLAAMADLHAAYLGSTAGVGLFGMARRVGFFAPDNLVMFDGDDELPVPVAYAHQGWAALDELAPGPSSQLRAIHGDPSSLVAAMAATPATLLHGDWKLANLGRRPDGRTILLDWALPGSGPPCWEIAWYLALNRARLPTSKEQALASYRQRLELAGVGTDGWWDTQLALCLLGVTAVFGWEKALGDREELEWWLEAAAGGWRLLS